jgi:hypothetical protein
VENLVCLSPEDVGYWEIGARLLGKVWALHAFLPNMYVVLRLITAHFKGAFNEPGRANPTIWGWRAPLVGADQWKPPIGGLRDEALKKQK